MAFAASAMPRWPASINASIRPPPRWGLLKKPDQLQRNWFQRLRPGKLVPYGAIKDCCNC